MMRWVLYFKSYGKEFYFQFDSYTKAQRKQSSLDRQNIKSVIIGT